MLCNGMHSPIGEPCEVSKSVLKVLRPFHFSCQDHKMLQYVKNEPVDLVIDQVEREHVCLRRKTEE